MVQDLVLTARVVRYRRERWLTPAGETVVAPLPGGVRGHFGPELRRFVLMQHHHGQVTVERLVTLLQAVGISISKRAVLRLLIDGQEGFVTESREVLRAGLQTAAWITVDDTGARRQFADRAAWHRHLAALDLATMQITPDPVCVATEGALWGSIQAHGFLRDTVVVSDDAGQFDIGQHALCWVHAERLVHKLDTC